ncbi:MAG: hypothetical protein PHY74_07605 [Candidatus Bathyarchaeota archaeon]|nr:hypothetical protein [Candidatus Bathyarchaeota archaeon]
MTREAFMAIGVVSLLLVLVLVFLFFRVYRYHRSLFILCLPLGFLFLALSYMFLFAHFFYPNVPGLSASLMWLRVVTQTLGFTLIASSYLLSGENKGGTKFSLFTLSVWSIFSVICFFGLLFVINPVGALSIYSVNGIFTVANLALLTYILYFLITKLELKQGSVYGLVSAPVAFAFLWLGQFSFLIWKFDGGTASLFGSEITRVISLVLFIRIYYLASRRCSRPVDSNQEK